MSYNIEFKVIESADNKMTAHFRRLNDRDRGKHRKPVLATNSSYKADFLFSGKII